MKKIALLLLFVGISVGAFAAPIKESQARAMAQEFFATYATRSASCEVELEWAGSDFNVTRSSADEWQNAALYIYNRVGGGFVAIAGNDCSRPIVAYSFDNNFDADNLAETTRELLSAWCRQIAASESNPVIVTRADDGIGNVVKEYTTALWDQQAPYNLLCPYIDGNQAVTGCVATAMSIICHYNKWPETASGTMPAYDYVDWYGGERSLPEHTFYGEYDYDIMPLPYYGEDGSLCLSYTDEEGAAVAKLMRDMGASVYMGYHYGASGAISQNVLLAMTSYFSYSKDAYISWYHTSYESWVSSLQDNISNYGPTYFSGSSTGGGHAFVLDGYTDAGYFHINYGWSGVANGYYLLPEIDFYMSQAAIFGLTPDYDGSSNYVDKLSFIDVGPMVSTSKITPNKEFDLYIGGLLNEAATTFIGEVQVCHCDKYGELKSVVGSAEIELATAQTVNLAGVNNTISVSVTESMNFGDRLRIRYCGAYSDGEYQWIDCGTASAQVEVIIKATAEEMAKNICVSVIPPWQDDDGQKYKSLYFRSSESKIPFTYKVFDAETNEFISEIEADNVNWSGYSIYLETPVSDYIFRIFDPSGEEYYDMVITL